MNAVAAPAFEIRRSEQPSSWAAVLADLWLLTKPEVNSLIVIATFTGFYLGYPHLHSFPFGRMAATLGGTLLVASSAGALNQFLEWSFDARMRRTSGRPVAAGRLRPVFAFWFGVALAVIGLASLWVLVNAIASVLALVALAIYLLLYTPLKRKSPLCTVVGAFSGAIPPLIGWAAAAGTIASAEAWEVYALLFFWQFPHFMAIAWMYREDYARAQYLVLPAKSAHRFLGWFTAVPSIGLFLASLAASAGDTGDLFPLCATVILGLSFLFLVRRQIVDGSRSAARRLLKITVFYLILQMAVLIVAKD